MTRTSKRFRRTKSSTISPNYCFFKNDLFFSLFFISIRLFKDYKIIQSKLINFNIFIKSEIACLTNYSEHTPQITEKDPDLADYAKTKEVGFSLSLMSGIIRQYEMMLCRRCFRENRSTIGFVKYR